MSAFTKISPTTMGLLPSGVTEIGGIVLDLVGQNGVRVVSQLSANSLVTGFFSSPTFTIGTQTGFTSQVLNALGGGLSEVAVRITLFDGDTGSGDFDDNQNFLLLNGVQLGNFSDIFTQSTSEDGLTVFSTNSLGGFRNDTVDTGFFYSNNATFLSSFYTSLSSGQVAFELSDVDPGDNFFDFTRGVSGGLVNVGQAPNISPVINSLTNNGPINEGGTAIITVNASDPDNTTGGLTYKFDLDNDGTYETVNTTGTAQRTFADNGNFTFNVQVEDSSGGVTNGSTSITVNNVAPVLQPITSNLVAGKIFVGDTLTIGSIFTDVGTDDTHTGSINWDDTNTSDLGTVVGTASGNHIYNTPGIYTANLKVTDDDTASGNKSITFEVVSKTKDIVIDWKPGSNPSAINLSAKGTVPVAILGTADFNVSQIAIGSIRADDQKDSLLNGGGVGVNVKNNGQYQFSYQDVNTDGFQDLVLHFDTQTLGSVVKPNEIPFSNQIYLYGQAGSSAFLGTQQLGDPIKFV